ncbi:protein-disulfide reductase DsbD domain-containing protein [Aureliella helgolandensis]|uniref:Thiol:disulfide interchange protein DsbD N-terminal domain-containing protein n=1 Tax=Aureliella helgolandensis TaxID=2527968 RepID=A0A518GBV7_9BACT|nr:protein-disulfide reductase DsbD domain-containing protein [Aureliella helgolandensis]QDV26053.1 hypothetical protein Q31a_44240 [Aureliella helgolandensis]
MRIPSDSTAIRTEAARSQHTLHWPRPNNALFAVLTLFFLGGCQSRDQPLAGSDANTVETGWQISLVDPAIATDQAGNVNIEASVTELGGTTEHPVEVAVDISIKRGSHVYGAVPSSSPFTPLSIQGDVDVSSVNVGEAILPATDETEVGKPVFRNSFTAHLPLKMISPEYGTFLLTIRVKFQVCNDLACLPPEEVVMQLPVRVERSTSL